MLDVRRQPSSDKLRVRFIRGEKRGRLALVLRRCYGECAAAHYTSYEKAVSHQPGSGYRLTALYGAWGTRGLWGAF